jgi:hypothetical protein
MGGLFSVSGKTCRILDAKRPLQKPRGRWDEILKTRSDGGFFVNIMRYIVDHKDTTVVAGSKLFINHTKHFRII